MRRFLFCCLLLGCLIGQSSGAFATGMEMEGLYQTLVPVATQDPAERREALNTALFNVLVKVSGQARERLGRYFGAQVKDPVRFVRQYRYESLPKIPGSAIGNAQALGLGVEFDKEAVDRLLRDAALPVWGRVRPTTLVWLAAETDGTRALISAGERPELWNALQARATARGVPLVIPLLDIEDQTTLKPADVWGGFAESIRSASARYGNDIILVGRLYRGASGFAESSWLLYRPDSETNWLLREGTHIEQAAEAIDRLADVIARDFATVGISGTAPGQIEMVISGVRSLDQYGRLMRYLQNQDTIDTVVPVVADGDRLTLRIHTTVGSEQVVQSLALGQVLRPISTDGGLEFELVP